MKYFFYPERRFVTFAPIMSNNPKSPIIDLQQQQLLLRMEYEYEKEEFKRQTETMGVARKVKRGLCWYPVSLGRSYYNSLCSISLSIFSLKSNTTAIEMISAIANTYVPKNFLMIYQSSRFINRLLFISYNLVDTLLTIIGFQVEKSPAIMCFLASPASHR